MDPGARRWRGQVGRIEVWYATFTHEPTGTGVWVHAEITAPTDGAAAFGHGWIALFPPDQTPVVERFGPGPLRSGDGNWFATDDCTVGPHNLVARTATMGCDLAYGDAAAPLFTFPRWAWEREVLPGAQIVPMPTATFTGAVMVDGEKVVDGGRGGVAHIYGHGNAERWGWLHADLGGGDVLEIVSAVSRRPGLNRLPPTALVQLRLNGEDVPRQPLLAAPLLRTRLGLPTWSVQGRLGRRRLAVEVTIPEDRAVRLDYADPDGAPAVCVNSEVASARIDFDGRRWELEGTAHAEVGLRDG